MIDKWTYDDIALLARDDW